MERKRGAFEERETKTDVAHRDHNDKGGWLKSLKGMRDRAKGDSRAVKGR